MLHDTRMALRALWRRRGLTLAVVLTLTLGIGANSAIFSAVDAVLLRPLPYPAADRLVSVYESNLAKRQSTSFVAPGRLEEWNELNQTFAGLAATYFENMTDTSGPLPERLEGIRTSPRFFSVLGVPAAVGRTFTPAEERFGGPRVVVLSDAFWRRRFAGDASVVGRPLTIGGASCTIVGVMPPSFRFPTDTTEVWMPTQAPAMFLAARGARLYRAFGRLRTGVTPQQAQADLSTVEARLATQFPATDAGWSAAVVPLKEEQVGGVRKSLWFLLGAVGLVLLTACGNVACLMLADATRREHEVAVRFALGASRARVLRQLLAEGVLLALGGALLGLVAARWGIDLLRSTSSGLPRLAELRVDARLVAFTLVVGVLTTMVFALAPALQATREGVNGRLAKGGRASTGGKQRPQRLLVAAQMALAIVLLSGAGLLLRSFERLSHTSPGFDPADVLAFRMSAQWSERTDAVMSRHLRTLARLAAVPGVASAAFSSTLPAGLDFPAGEFRITGRDTGERHFATSREVSADYFRTLRIPILQGETCRDDPAKPYASVLVTRAFADEFFPGENPIGHFVEPLGIAGLRQEILGVVGDVRENGIVKDAPALMYTCGLQPYWPDPYFLVRTEAGRQVPVAVIRAAMREIEPGRAMYAVAPLVDLLGATVSQQRLTTRLVGLFALTAVILAAVGLYGVLSQFVAARRREIGVRLALGARMGHIVSTIALPAAAMTGAGTAVGVAGALILARFMSTLVFGISTRDPLTFAVVPVLLAFVAGATTIVPARRAARVEPTEALREE